MPVDQSALMEALCVLASDYDMKVCVSESLKGGLIAGASSTVGGVVLGPVGLAIGALLGGLYAATHAHGKFQSAVIVVRNMTPYQQEELINKLAQAFQNVNPADLLPLLLVANMSTRQLAIQVLTEYLTSQGMRVTSMLN